MARGGRVPRRHGMEIITKNDDGSLSSREAVADVTFRHNRHQGEIIVNGQDLSWYVTKNGVSIEIRDGLPRVIVEISPLEQLEVVLEKAQIEFRQAPQDEVVL